MQSITNSRTLLRLGDGARSKVVYSSNLYCTRNTKTPENMAKLTARERERERETERERERERETERDRDRERAIGMVQLGASYTHVARILNCTIN